MQMLSELVGRIWPLRLSRWTIRTRLVVLFPAVFLACGAVLLGGTVEVWNSATAHVHVNFGGTAHVHLPPQLGAQFGSLTRLLTRTANAVQTGDSHQLVIAAAAAFAMMAVLSVALGWLLARGFMGPLRAITARTREISATNLHERVNLVGPEDEFKELADTFDQLLDRLERSFSFERRFVANASHELRTPLSAMRASLDVAMAKPGRTPAHIRALDARLRRELDQVDRLLAGFLALAQAQQGPLTDAATVSLAEIARRAIEQRTEAISRAGLEVSQTGDPNVSVSGSDTLLSRMVENVIDNAITHNEPGGWVRVTVSAVAGQARLVVENGGPLLDPDQVGQLTEPFRRLGAERTGSEKGSGLGLSIVAAIIEVHDGSLELEARGGGGLRVAITLPTAAGENS
jgi:signal transduction histidine kinase